MPLETEGEPGELTREGRGRDRLATKKGFTFSKTGLEHYADLTGSDKGQ